MTKTDTTSRRSANTDFRQLPLSEMEEMVARFEERVLAAQISSSPTCDLVRNAVRREGAQRCPVWLRRVSPDLIIKYGDALTDLFVKYPDDLGRIAPYDAIVGYNPKASVSQVEALMKNSEWVNEWGVGWKHVVGGVGATEVSNPLEDWSRLDDYIANEFPDPLDPGRLEKAIAPTDALHRAGKYVFGLFGPAFYHMFSIRGMENVLMDFYIHEDELRRLIDALLEYSLKLVKGWAQIGVDALLVLDDWGMQQSLMISPKTWREFFKPAYKTLFDEIHLHGMDTFLHSCGCVTEIVEDLIEVGLDVLDPIQTSAMDINELARRFGGRLSFCGTIDVQHLLPGGSPSDIKDAVRRSVDTLARRFGNGLILAPTNVITPDTSIENLRAMFEVCHEC